MDCCCDLRITIGSNIGFCSGWIISENTVVTAAHCLYDREHNYAQEILVTPALNGTEKPFGTCNSTSSWIHERYPENFATNYDFAVITLDCLVGKRTGYLGFRVMSDSELLNASSLLVGYAGEPELGGGTKMYLGFGNILDSSNPQVLFYNNDTSGCQSGSAVWEMVKDFCGRCAVAVHSGYDSNHELNTGARIDLDIFRFLFYFKYKNKPTVYLPLVKRPYGALFYGEAMSQKDRNPSMGLDALPYPIPEDQSQSSISAYPTLSPEE